MLPRPKLLSSATYRLKTERGTLWLTITLDEQHKPFEVFGSFGKAGSFERGVTELACRLISVHLRRGTPLSDIIKQCEDISEMQPQYNMWSDGSSIAVRGLGDAIAHVLKEYVDDNESNSH